MAHDSHYLFSQEGQRIILPQASVQGHLQAAKKPNLSVEVSCVRVIYFTGRPTYRPCRLKTCQWHVLGKRKAPTFQSRLSVFALSIFPGSHPPSIVDAYELNFCVRDGNRWTLIAINTNFYGWLFTIFYIKSIPASNTLVTHTGFEPMLTA